MHGYNCRGSNSFIFIFASHLIRGQPVLSSRHLSFKTRGRVYSMCVRSTMLHASETWPVTKPCLQRLQRNDRAMIRQICNIKPQDTATIRAFELLARLGIEDAWKGAHCCGYGPYTCMLIKNMMMMMMILKKRICSPRSKFFSKRVDSIFEGLHLQRKQTGSHESFSLEIHGGVHIHLKVNYLKKYFRYFK